MPHSRIIPLDIDKRCRWLIVEYANIAALPQSLIRDLEKLLESPDAHPQALQHATGEFADELRDILPRAQRITRAIQHFLDVGPRGSDPTQENTRNLTFVKWLGASGWGNDIRLIRLFAKWSEEADRRKKMRRTAA